MRRSLPVLLTVALAALLVAAPRPATARADATCGLSNPAFCDPFAAPSSGGTRSGQLDGVVWGVSRATSLSGGGNGSPSYPWASVSADRCGTAKVVAPESDVAVCGGRMVEAVNDNGGQTVLAAYPRQPFDIAGRAGTVAFAVSNDTQGTHGAWPAFEYTDQPVPAPYGQLPGLSDNPRNSFGIEFAGLCGAGSDCGGNVPPGGASATCWTVDAMWLTANYALTGLKVAQDGCVDESTPDGSLNTVHIQLSTSGVVVLAGDPGSSVLRQIAHTDATVDPAFDMPLTRGLVWAVDAHYNADKFGTQQSDTFAWSDFGFDGPALPQDRGFDVLDNTTPGPAAENGLPTQAIGYRVPYQGAVALSTLPVDATSLANASGAVVTLLCEPFGMFGTAPPTLSVALNGGAATAFPWPYPPSTPTFSSASVAIPVPLSDVHTGVNTLTLTDESTDGASGLPVASIDLILLGAGGAPVAPTATATPAATATPGATATATPSTHTFSLSCSWDGSNVSSIDCKGR